MRQVMRRLEPINSCHYSRGRERGTLTRSRQSFAEDLVKKSDVSSVQSSMRMKKLKIGRFVNMLVV